MHGALAIRLDQANAAVLRMRMLGYDLRPASSARIRGRSGVALRGCVVALLGIVALAAGAEAPDASDVASDDGGSPTETRRPSVYKPTTDRQVEEIIIMGESMAMVVQDKTASVIGFDLGQIKAEGISDIRDLSNFTPSLQIKSAFAASNPTLFIRGVGLDDFNANSASAVAIYQDGVYMQSPAGQLFQFYDVDEENGAAVLRGPQPSLYRNAEAGAILVRSKRPTEELSGYLSATYGNYHTYETETALGGPIVPELLLGRVSATWGIRDGITKNRCAKAVAGKDYDPNICDLSNVSASAPLLYEYGMDEWANDADAWAARGQLLLRLPSFDVGNDMEWLLNVHGGQNRSRALQFQHRGAQFRDPVRPDVPTLGGPDESNYQDTDGDPFAGEYNIDGPEKIDLFGSNLDVVLPLGGGFELHGLTAYEWNDGITVENTDASPRFVLESVYEDSAWQLSQELALRGEWDDLFAWDLGEGEWQVGGYYLQEDLEAANHFDTGPPAADHLDQFYDQKTRNLAGFAYSEYRLRPGCQTLLPCDFTLVTGVRYNREEKEFETFVCQQGGLTPCDRGTLPPPDKPELGQADGVWTGWGYEASLAWDFAADASVYGKYSHGWKGGHFNGGAVTIFDLITGVDPETVDSYEAGLRSFWFDSRLMLNVTGFYYDYKDLQVFIIEQTPPPGGYPIPKLANAADSTVYGVELDLGAQPIEDLNITFNAAWVESEYEEFTVAFAEKIQLPRPCRTCPRPDPPFVIIPREFQYQGNPLIGSPRYSMTGTVDYTLYLPGSVFGQGLGSLTPRYSFSWKDQVYFDQCSGRGQRCNFPKGTFGQEAYWVHNASLAWTSEDESIEVLGWVRNFLDEHYKTQNFDLSRGLGIILDAYADPRTFGVTVTYSF